jgi:hypothetical protein
MLMDSSGKFCFPASASDTLPLDTGVLFGANVFSKGVGNKL